MKKVIIMMMLFVSVSTGNGQLTEPQQTEFCKVLIQLVESSRESFESIKNERKNGVIELYYTSKLNLPTASDTRIILRGDAWFLSAKLQERTDRKKAEQDFNGFVSVVRNCFKTWRPVAAESVSSKGRSIAFKEAVDNECGPRITISMDETPTKYGVYKIMLSIHSN